MAEHLAYRFDGYIVLYCNGCGERVSRNMKCKILIYIAQGRDLLKVIVDLLVTRYREQPALFPLYAVFFDYPYRDIEQLDIYRVVRFVAGGVDPETAVGTLYYIILRPFPNLDLIQSG